MIKPRLFELVRFEDLSDVSGVGVVADGVEFGDGTCVLHWLSNFTSTSVYHGLADLIAIHGHGGSTRVRFCEAKSGEVLVDQPDSRLNPLRRPY